MNAFEEIAELLFLEEGYWVKKSVKLNISTEEKKEIGKPKMPRPEIDLVAYNLNKNELLLVEVKSFLNSQGVGFETIVGKGRNTERYKLFNNEKYSNIIQREIKKEFTEKGLIKSDAKIKLALVAGKVKQGDEDRIREHFKEKGWEYFSPEDVRKKLEGFKDKDYEDNVVIMTVKLLLRKKSCRAG